MLKDGNESLFHGVRGVRLTWVRLHFIYQKPQMKGRTFLLLLPHAPVVKLCDANKVSVSCVWPLQVRLLGKEQKI